jgi:hypothetical protein
VCGILSGGKKVSRHTWQILISTRIDEAPFSCDFLIMCRSSQINKLAKFLSRKYHSRVSSLEMHLLSDCEAFVEPHM